MGAFRAEPSGGERKRKSSEGRFPEAWIQPAVPHVPYGGSPAQFADRSGAFYAFV
jgi:hypothetical protein